MINQNICIPITGSTLQQAEQDIRKAETLVDVIELRVDCLDSTTPEAVKKLLSFTTKKTIVTCRSKNEGGKFTGTDEEYNAVLHAACEGECDFVDIELQRIASSPPTQSLIKNKGTTKTIISCHNFKETPSAQELAVLYERCMAHDPDAVKIVTYAQSVLDNFTIFDLLKGKSNLIAFCMGVAGEMSRILALKYGTRLTFASLEAAKASAPGQVSITEMRDAYNVDAVNRSTRILGVIGSFAENSQSKYMHNSFFREKELNFVYVPFKVQIDELGEFMQRFRKHAVSGAAVTIPHKIAIMDHIDTVDETAQQIGAVNTIVNRDGTLIGYNTDYIGAVAALEEKTKLKAKKVLVIGAGGGARAVIYGLLKKDAYVTIVNRSNNTAEALAQEWDCKVGKLSKMKDLIATHDIIINTTSVGMHPEIDESIVQEDDFTPGKIVMDIVYKPLHTKFVQNAQHAGCSTITGDRMLLHQARGQAALWTGTEPDVKSMERACKKYIIGSD